MKKLSFKLHQDHDKITEKLQDKIAEKTSCAGRIIVIDYFPVNCFETEGAVRPFSGRNHHPLLPYKEHDRAGGYPAEELPYIIHREANRP